MDDIYVIEMLETSLTYKQNAKALEALADLLDDMLVEAREMGNFRLLNDFIDEIDTRAKNALELYV